MDIPAVLGRGFSLQPISPQWELDRMLPALPICQEKQEIPIFFIHKTSSFKIWAQRQGQVCNLSLGWHLLHLCTPLSPGPELCSFWFALGDSAVPVLYRMSQWWRDPRPRSPVHLLLFLNCLDAGLLSAQPSRGNMEENSLWPKTGSCLFFPPVLCTNPRALSALNK